MKRLSTIRFDATNVDAFIYIVGSQDGNYTIDMHLLDYKWSDGTVGESCWVVNKLEDLVTWFIVSEATTKVFAPVVLIDDGLTAVAKNIVVGDDRNWHEHVSVENKSAGGNLQSAMDCRSNGILCGSKCTIYDLICFGHVAGRMR